MKKLVCVLALFGYSVSVYAADGSWTNTAVDGFWTNSANWTGGVVPGAGDTAIFEGSGGNTTIDLASGSTLAVKTIEFKNNNETYTIGASGAGAQTLNLDGTGGGITLFGTAANQTVDANLTLGSGAASSTHNFNVFSSVRTLTLNGDITKNSTGAVTYRQNGAGTVRLNGDVSGLNYFQVYKGTLQVEADNLNDATLSAALIGGNNTDTGTYEFIGATDQVLADRQFAVGDNTAGTDRTGGLTILNNGEGTVTISKANQNRNNVTAERTLTLGGSNTGDNTFAGIIQDNNASAKINLAKQGAGKWLLSNGNTYSGTTTIEEGILQFQSKSALYNNAQAQWTEANITVESGGTLALRTGSWGGADIGTLFTNLNQAGAGGFEDGSYLGLDTSTGNFTYWNSQPAITDNGDGGSIGVRKLGANKLTMTDDYTYTGDTIVEQGTLEFGGGFGKGQFAGNAQIASGATLSFNKNDNTTIVGDISGAGTLAVNNQAANDELILSGTLTHAATEVNLGELVFANAADSSYTGTISGGGTVIQRGDGAANGNFAGEILELSGNNSYSGGTIIANETRLRASHNNALGTGSVTLGGEDAGLLLAEGVNIGNNLVMDNIASRNHILAEGDATYSGDMAIDNTSEWNFHLRANDGKTLTVSGDISDHTGGSGGLVVTRPGSGGGTVILSGNNTYSGVTRISAGGNTLQIDGDNSGATGDVFVDFGTLTGSGTVGGAVTVNANGFLQGTLTFDASVTVAGKLNPGNSPGAMTFNSDLTIEDTATLTLELDGTAQSLYDTIINGDANDTITFEDGATIAFDVGYTAQYGDSFEVLKDWNSYVGTLGNLNFTGTDLGGGLSLDTSNLLTTGTVNVIPEPAVISLIGLFGIGVLFAKRRFTK